MEAVVEGGSWWREGPTNTQGSRYILQHMRPHWLRLAVSKGFGIELGPKTCCLLTLWQRAPCWRMSASRDMTTVHQGPHRDPGIPWGGSGLLHLDLGESRGSEEGPENPGGSLRRVARTQAVPVTRQAKAVLAARWAGGREDEWGWRRRLPARPGWRVYHWRPRDVSLPDQGGALADGTQGKDMCTQHMPHT